MTAFQSTLGEDGEDIAVQLAENQREISIAEFFEKNKHMLGFDSGARALVTATKEAVDNSLDATEEAGYLPDIYVEIEDRGEYYGIVVEDNGPGITEAEIPKVFGKLLYGSRFHVREQSLTPEQRILVRHEGRLRTVAIGRLCDAVLPRTGEATRSVPDGWEAPAFDRETGAITWEPITHVIRHASDEATYRITTTNGRTVTVTGNHSLFSKDEAGDPIEVAAGTLSPGDQILAPRRLPRPGDTLDRLDLTNRGTDSASMSQPAEGAGSIEIDRQFVEAIAEVVRNRITVHENRSARSREKTFAERRPEGPVVEGDGSGSNGQRLTARRVAWEAGSVDRTVLEALGEEANGEEAIPGFVYRLDPNLQLEFLRGLFRPTGATEAAAGDRWRIRTEREVAGALATLAAMVGIDTSVERPPASGDGEVDDETVVSVAVAAADLDGVADIEGNDADDLCLLEVASVERVESPPFVYDISVPGATGYDENFVVVNEGPICVKNSRGQQGIGISAAVLYAQLTSGKPAKITSRTAGGSTAQYFELIIDTDRNEPEIKVKDETRWDRPHGTRIELELEANLRARSQLQDYIQQTAVVNPHARIEFHEPAGTFKFERATDELPDETEAIRPHPHGVELGTVIKMLKGTNSRTLSGFLQEEFTRVGRKTAGEILDGFRDRHFGREVPWRSPPTEAIVEAVTAATANKSKAATEAFAEGIGEAVTEAKRLTHFELVGLVESVADQVEADHGETFGATVRENAADAAWERITANRRNDLYAAVDEATSTRKDDATVAAVADRLTEKFEADDDHRDRLTRTTVRAYVDRAADMAEEIEDRTFGETARNNVVEQLWSSMRTVPDDAPSVRRTAEDRDTASHLVEAMREASVMAPPTNCLAPISADLVEAGLRKEYDADFYTAATRSADVHAGDPFIVEAGIAYGGELDPDGPVDVMRFANRVPLVYQRGACAITDVVKSIGWRNYALDQPGGAGIPQGPGVILVHVASTNVPFTSESKDAVANIPVIEDEIELAIREAARELKSYLNKRRSLEQRQRKQSRLTTILPRMAEKVAEVTERDPPNIDDALARIMNNVLVEREIDDGTVSIAVENHVGTTERLEITDIVSTKPNDLSDGATVTEMDGEWYVQWAPEVADGETVVLEYTVETEETTFDIDVQGIADEKLTVVETA